jgi:DHA1 family bicyclomycin/chloramphenicol resistance-like MFS transporter
LLGAMQLGLGAVSSSAMGLFSGRSAVPLATIMTAAAVISAAVLFIGRRNIKETVEAEGEAVVAH